MNIILFATVDVLDALISVLTLAIFARAILSWIKPDPNHRLVVGLNQITNPILRPIQNKLPGAFGFDFSPLIAIAVLYIIQRVGLEWILSQITP